MTITTTATRAAKTARKPLARPLNVVGPYSAWPRERGVVRTAPIILATATVTGAAVAHCVLPVLA